MAIRPSKFVQSLLIDICKELGNLGLQRTMCFEPVSSLTYKDWPLAVGIKPFDRVRGTVTKATSITTLQQSINQPYHLLQALPHTN